MASKWQHLYGVDDLRHLPALLTALGASFHEVDDWKSRTIDQSALWNPEWVINHHTANPSADGHESLGWLVHGGIPGVRPPYAHALVGREPTIFLIAAGRANHAGLGGPFKNVPKDSMNAYGYGIEVEAPGRELDFAPGQFELMCQLNAAVLWILGQGISRVIRHKDWTDGGVDGVPTLPTKGRKVDIKYSLTQVRTRTQVYIDKLQGDAPVPKPPVGGGGNARPKCDLSYVQLAARKDGARPNGAVTPHAKPHVLLVENALVDIGYLERKFVDGSFGTKTTEAYARWQRRLGYRGKDADGIPGESSLKALGKSPRVKTKFNVVP